MTTLNLEMLAVIVLIAALIIDRILGMLKTRGIDLQIITRQIDDLHNWHNQHDDEGVKIWYVRRSLEEAVHKLAQNIELEAKLLDRIDGRLARIEAKLNT